MSRQATTEPDSPRSLLTRARRTVLGCLLTSLSAAAQQAPAAVPSLKAEHAADVTPGQSLLREEPAGTITGIVTDTGGAIVSGAMVELASAGAVHQQMLSRPDGKFTFQHVANGAFAVSVVLQGFVTATAAGTLQRGQTLDLQVPPLKLATAYFDVDVFLPPADVAEEQIHEQEKQRLGGFLPNFFVSYEWKTPPLSAKQKFSLAFKNASDPGNLLLVGTVAGVQQATDEFNAYGQGAAGYGRRFGADLGNLVVGTMLGGAVFPSLFHQDPRYFYKGTGSIRSRALYALSSAVICRGDNGHRQPAFAGVLGDLSAGAISNLYYPRDRHDIAITLENGFLGVAGDALNGLFQEFFARMLTPAKPERKSAKNLPSKD